MDVAIVEAERLLHSRRAALERLFAAGSQAPAGAGAAERRELAEIVEALNRIASGTYGTCQACGGAIGRQRLRALPEIRHCMSCST